MTSAPVQPPLFPPPDSDVDQFRLTRLQIFNWGTFSGVFDFPIAYKGHLFIGPSGSGKSTLLDAHAALLTPPKWLDFNVAARESERRDRDRNPVTYLRGAWAEQTGDDGEYVSQYLRAGTTWTALSETYRNGAGRYVTLVLLLWIRGESNKTSDVRRLYIVLERALELRELETFAKLDFDVRRFKQLLTDAQITDEFSTYQERFRRMLGIDTERALRLLHKTQSAKNLGDLNTFLRDFMLDPPETLAVADRLVTEFGELNAAHEAVLAAAAQIATLTPARDALAELEEKKRIRTEVAALSAALEPYCHSRRIGLLQQLGEKLAVQFEGASQEAQRLREAAGREEASLSTLREARLGRGGALIEEIERQIQSAEAEKPPRLARRETARKACDALGWTLPDESSAYVQLVDVARRRLLDSSALRQRQEEQRDELKSTIRVLGEKLQIARIEIEAMERQRSNIPSSMLDLRHRISTAIGVADELLPFAGELLEVREDEQRWQGAIERVLRGFAFSLLVDNQYYAAVSSYVNGQHVGERLVYLLVLPHASFVVGQGSALDAASLVKKLKIAAGPLDAWLRAELRTRFDYLCASTSDEFRAARQAVTERGQVKHNHTRHEKDDRFAVDNRKRWVLGFDNKAKLELFKNDAFELATSLQRTQDQLEAARRDDAMQNEQMLHCQALVNITWSDIDLPSIAAKVHDLQTRLAAEKAAHPDLEALDRQIEVQARMTKQAAEARTKAEAELLRLETEQRSIASKVDSLSRLLSTPLEAALVTELERRFNQADQEISLESLDPVARRVTKTLGDDRDAATQAIADLGRAIEDAFKEFNRSWPAESGGLDPTLASAQDYFAKLMRLEIDGLPKFKDRFLKLLREQSDQNVLLLQTRLEQERKAIGDRMELVNESLATAPFNPGTHLTIETSDKMIEDVRAFRQALRASLTHAFSGNDENAEARFESLRALVKRLSSQETVDRAWRMLVLDVRQHVEFVAKELDGEGTEVEVYRSGAGKSGGQRQKLAATCLAAALRYQLGGQERALPSFSTVALDEAFDKADAEFTALAMNIFKTFGFQMLVATPLKSVMTLEPFVGGATYVHIRDRKNSSVIPIAYDEDSERLRLTPEIQGAESSRGEAVVS